MKNEVVKKLPVTVLSGFLGELIVRNKPADHVDKISQKIGF